MAGICCHEMGEINNPVEKYIERCEQDVRINLALWERILSKLTSLYSNLADINRYIDYLSFKMKCAALQERNQMAIRLTTCLEDF